MSDQESIIPGYDDPHAFSQTVLQAVVECLKMSSGIPNSGADFKYYSTFRGFRAIMQKERNTIMTLMKSLIPGQSTRNAFDENDIEDKFDILLDMNASIFENVGSQLDEATNPKKAAEDLIIATKKILPINTSWNRKPNSSLKTNQNYSLLSSKNIQRPQLLFKQKVDNSNSPFVPSITEKPNSIKPLAILVENGVNGEEFSHPYEFELVQFQPTEEQLQACEPQFPPPVEETPLIMVDTEDNLNAMLSDLRSQSEFAVDVENHSYRSFQGFACLIQISTRQKDYIVDAIKLRSELHILNEVLTDPKIVKVLHGADMDIQWLQRDFGLYIVNLFDTGQASRVLNFAHFSLAHLLNHYCNLNVDKQFQLADWRIRPLPPPLIKYAREDTHFLLYVYDRIKNDLLKEGLKKGRNATKSLLDTITRSRDICLKKYEKHLFDDKTYLKVYDKSRKLFAARQLLCLKELYAWRDDIARREDESYGYILPNHMLLRIAETIPKDPQGIIACCNPVPPCVLQQLNELHGLIMKANNTPLNTLEASPNTETITQVNKPVDTNNMLHSLHDIQFNKDRKTLTFPPAGSFDMQDLTSVKLPLKTEPSLPLFKLISSQEERDTESYQIAQTVAKSIDDNNKTPYERYLLTKNFRDATYTKEDEATTNKEILSKSFIEVQSNSLNNSSVNVSSSNDCSVSSPSTSNKQPTAEERQETIESLKNLIERKKKKRKSGRVAPDLSFEVTTQNKIAKQSEATPFTPFDYSQTDVSILSNKKKGRGPGFEPYENSSHHKKSGKKSWKRKDSGKRWVSSSQSNSKSWPKN